ncbi:mCG147413 [Mus musculus]|jgi:hypothetical protein|nr:mCG147413 [Mus musculus]
MTFHASNRNGFEGISEMDETLHGKLHSDKLQNQLNDFLP